MFSLSTKELTKNTWYWWWWLFFIKSKDTLPKQLMILWSTKNCKKIKVNSFNWERNKNISQNNGKTEFDGMICSWFFDGKKMIDEFVFDRDDLIVEHDGNFGKLFPKSEKYNFEGDEKNYKVRITNKKSELNFEMSHWNDFLVKHRYTEKHYLKKFNYNILKIYGMKMKGILKENGKEEKFDGSAYFQKVMVNAPATPWYWGIVHTERGDFLEYFKPNIGLQMLRKDSLHASIFDSGEIPLSKRTQFYDAEKNELHVFKKMKLSKVYENDLPIFKIKGRNENEEIEFVLKAYSRAYWRFEEPSLFIKSILYYNEYPTILSSFLLKGKNGKIGLEDLGYNVGNSEHTWGKLI